MQPVVRPSQYAPAPVKWWLDQSSGSFRLEVSHRAWRRNQSINQSINRDF